MTTPISVSLLDPMDDPRWQFRLGKFPLEYRPAALERLEAVGYFGYTAASDLEMVRRKVLKAKFLNEGIFCDEVMRSVYIDAEEVFESSAADFISENDTVFRRHGLIIQEFDEVEKPDTDFSRAVVLNGFEFTIVNDATRRHKYDDWYLATDHVVRAINFLLDQIGSAERLYWDPTLNEMCVLVTKPQLELLYRFQVVGPLKYER